MAIPKRLRRPLIPAIVVLLALGVWAEIWYSRRLTENPAVSSPIETPTPASPVPSPPATAPAPENLPSPPFAPPDAAALLELDKVHLMLRDYRSVAGENPVGTNAEIMAAVMGKNPRQATLGPPEGTQLNEEGELLDRWGTPYFFHQLSRDRMEIRSAGVDKVMWTEDDAVLK